MKITIHIDHKLMQDALHLTKRKTKREVVEMGLKRLVKLDKQELRLLARHKADSNISTER